MVLASILFGNGVGRNYFINEGYRPKFRVSFRKHWPRAGSKLVAGLIWLTSSKRNTNSLYEWNT